MGDEYDPKGIALVVEEAGQGAKLVFRYPGTDEFQYQNPFDVTASVSNMGATLSEKLSKNPKSNDDTERNNGSNSKFVEQNPQKKPNLFFSLPHRTMEKLFRPKPPLCDQAMTLSVGGTVFCYRAAPLATHLNTTTKSKMILFSVIIALSPKTEPCPKLKNFKHGHISQTKNRNEKDISSKNVDENQKKSFQEHTATLQIHNLLHRLCRVLQREEHRCQYVSKQSKMLLSIMDEEKQSLLSTLAVSGINMNMMNSTNPNTSMSLSADSSTHGNLSLSHSRNPSINESLNLTFNKSVNISFNNPSSATTTYTHNPSQQKRVITIEHEQNILERMLASVDHSSPYSNGNLARELAQVFHTLALSDSALTTPSSSSSLISSNTNHPIVYVNAHIALPVPTMNHSRSSLPRASVPSPSYPYLLRPYHTLLFSHTSLDQLHLPQMLQNLSENFSHNYSYNYFTFPSPKRSKLLLMSLSISHPQKSIAELSHMAGIPLPQSLEIASALLLHPQQIQSSQSQSSPSQQTYMCIRSHGLHSSTRFTCQENVHDRISGLSLSFAQKFGTNHNLLTRNSIPLPPLFLVVSTFVSTPSMTLSLGQILTILTSSPSTALKSTTLQASPTLHTNSSFRESLPQSPSSSTSSFHEHEFYDEDTNFPAGNVDLMELPEEKNLNDVPMDIPDEVKPLREYMDHCIRIDTKNRNELESDENSIGGNNITNIGGTNNYGSNGIDLGLGMGNSYSGFMNVELPQENTSFGTNINSTMGASSATPTKPTISQIQATAGSPTSSIVSQTPLTQRMEQFLFSMVIWLRAHNILVEMRDYIISTSQVSSTLSSLSKEGILQEEDDEEESNEKGNNDTTLDLETVQKSSDKSKESSKSTQSVFKTSSPKNVEADSSKSTSIKENVKEKNQENREKKEMYKVLLEGQCLNGNISTVAICWKYSWEHRDLLNFIEWGTERHLLDIVTRAPVEDDDWGIP